MASIRESVSCVCPSERLTTERTMKKSSQPRAWRIRALVMNFRTAVTRARTVNTQMTANSSGPRSSATIVLGGRVDALVQLGGVKLGGLRDRSGAGKGASTSRLSTSLLSIPNTRSSWVADGRHPRLLHRLRSLPNLLALTCLRKDSAAARLDTPVGHRAGWPMQMRIPSECAAGADMVPYIARVRHLLQPSRPVPTVQHACLVRRMPEAAPRLRTPPPRPPQHTIGNHR